MTDVRKVCALWMFLMLIAVCESNERSAKGEDGAKGSISEKPRTLDESNRVAELIKRIDLVENPTNTTSKELDPLEERNLFMDLITRADLAFEANEPNSINLMEPRHVRWMPIADLDRMLTNGAVRKELAVVIIGQWYVWVSTNKEEAKAIEEFASRTGEVQVLEKSAFWVKKGPTREGFAFQVNDKLRKAGFRQVVFANTYNGMYSRTQVGLTPAEEEAHREKPSLNSSSTNSLQHIRDK